MTEVMEQIGIKEKEIETKKEKRNVPKLRFKGFEDEWEEKRIGNFLDFYTTNSLSRENLTYEKGKIKNIHYGDIHMKFPVMLDVEKNSIPFINNLVDTSKFKCESFCKNGDIIIADASEDYEDIGKAVEIINIGNLKVVAGLHTILGRDNIGITANGFKGYMFQSNNVRKQIKVLAAGAKVLGISKSNLSNVRVKLPTLQEQKKIADFFSLVDKKIEKQNEKVEVLKTYKKGIMQKIFKQEIRFKDENGQEYHEWEEKKIKDIFNVSAGGDISKDNVSNESSDRFVYPIYSNSLTNDGLYGYSDIYKVTGETITVTGRGSLGIAKARYNKYFPIVRLLVLTPIIKCNVKFFEEVINNTNIYIESTGVPQLTAPQLSNIKVKVPIIDEQIKIGNFLNIIDGKIEKEEEKLEELKSWKKGLLQKMFV